MALNNNQSLFKNYNESQKLLQQVKWVYYYICVC